MNNDSNNSKAPMIIPTIQTKFGMVLSGGKPKDRKLPYLEYTDHLNREHSNTQKYIVLPSSYRVPNECIKLFYNCVISKIFPVNAAFAEQQKLQKKTTKKNKKNKKKNTKNAPKKEGTQIDDLILAIGSTSKKKTYTKNSSISPSKTNYDSENSSSSDDRPMIIIKSPLQRLFGNIYACTRDGITSHDFKKYIRSGKRLDIEQCVAMVISFLRSQKQLKSIRKPLIKSLIDEIGSEMILKSCMWRDGERDETHGWNKVEWKYFNFSTKYGLYEYIAQDFRVLMTKLRCIRHSKKPVKRRRCLRIPDMFYEYCDMVRAQEDEYRYDMPSSSWPMRDPNANGIKVIYVGNKKFNKMNRQMQRMQAIEWSFRKRIWRLKDQMLCGNIGAVMQTNDVVSLCFAFLSFERCSQKKIVSGMSGCSFLKKGESYTAMQNNPSKLTSFEEVLVRAALGNGNKNVLDLPVLTTVVTPIAIFKQKGIKQIEGGNGDDDEKKMDIGWEWEMYARDIDKCALMMEEYVIEYGNGRFDNLCYQKNVRGGKRGPVDDYNLLVDILRKFVKRFNEGIEQFEVNNGTKYRNSNYGYQFLYLHLPMTNHKFLAKDILNYNNAWKDDAFGNGKRPDWLKWLQFRRKHGVLKPVQCILW